MRVTCSIQRRAPLRQRRGQARQDRSRGRHLIARYIAHEHAKLHPYRPPSPEQRQLQRLLTRRAKLSRSRASVQQSLQGVTGLQAALRQLLERFDALIALIDARIGALVNACPQRQAAGQRLRTIPGVGPVVAPALLCVLERFAFAHADSFAAYTGLDPRPDDVPPLLRQAPTTPSPTDQEVPLPLAGEGRVRVRVPPLLRQEGSVFFSPRLSQESLPMCLSARGSSEPPHPRPLPRGEREFSCTRLPVLWATAAHEAEWRAYPHPTLSRKRERDLLVCWRRGGVVSSHRCAGTVHE